MHRAYVEFSNTFNYQRGVDVSVHVGGREISPELKQAIEQVLDRWRNDLRVVVYALLNSDQREFLEDLKENNPAYIKVLNPPLVILNKPEADVFVVAYTRN